MKPVVKKTRRVRVRLRPGGFLIIRPGPLRSLGWSLKDGDNKTIDSLSGRVLDHAVVLWTHPYQCRLRRQKRLPGRFQSAGVSQRAITDPLGAREGYRFPP